MKKKDLHLRCAVESTQARTGALPIPAPAWCPPYLAPLWFPSYPALAWRPPYPCTGALPILHLHGSGALPILHLRGALPIPAPACRGHRSLWSSFSTPHPPPTPPQPPSSSVTGHQSLLIIDSHCHPLSSLALPPPASESNIFLFRLPSAPCGPPPTPRTRRHRRRRRPRPAFPSDFTRARRSCRPEPRRAGEGHPSWQISESNEAG